MGKRGRLPLFCISYPLLYNGMGKIARWGREISTPTPRPLAPQRAGGCGLPRRGKAPPRNDRGGMPGGKYRSFRGHSRNTERGFCSIGFPPEAGFDLRAGLNPWESVPFCFLIVKSEEVIRKGGRGTTDCHVGALPLLAMTVEGCQVEKIGHSEGEAETPNGVSALLNFRRRRGSDLLAGLDPWESAPFLPSPWGRVAR